MNRSKERMRIWTVPFAQPKFAVIYGIFAGIIFGFGTNFVFSIFKEEKIVPWGLQQWAGICFITAAMMLALGSLLLQFFNDHLVRIHKEDAEITEKCIQFDYGDWGRPGLTRTAFAMFWAFLLIGIFLLVVLYTATQLPIPTDIANGV
ncbi:hypothetical protein ES708_02344 [subsurface metagenome]